MRFLYAGYHCNLYCRLSIKKSPSQCCGLSDAIDDAQQRDC